jgi:CBS domain-containing protein
MNGHYRRLSTSPLPAGTPVCRFERLLAGSVSLESPAVEVMTDLRQVKVITIGPETTLETALNRMISAGVRLLLVVARADAVVGLITARDLSGERPVEFAARERIGRDRIRVGDIMTPHQQIEVLSMEDVDRARVGDVVETLRAAGRQHALVVERLEPGLLPAVRGIFSITRIGRQLGVDIQPTGLVQSFAELELVMRAASTPPA